MGKIKVIIKRPDEEFGHVCAISNTLHNLQNTVEGHIETVTLPGGLVIICNEEGKLIDGIKPNFTLGIPYRIATGKVITLHEPIFGTVIVCGADGEDFADIPITLADWKESLKAWGN